jgi:hypothetical protein
MRWLNPLINLIWHLSHPPFQLRIILIIPPPTALKSPDRDPSPDSADITFRHGMSRGLRGVEILVQGNGTADVVVGCVGGGVIVIVGAEEAAGAAVAVSSFRGVFVVCRGLGVDWRGDGFVAHGRIFAR